MCGYRCVSVGTACSVKLCVVIAVCFCVYSTIMCGYSCVFVRTACAVMLRVAIAVCLCVQ